MSHSPSPYHDRWQVQQDGTDLVVVVVVVDAVVVVEVVVVVVAAHRGENSGKL